jgi:hypothetical protein
MTNKPMSLPQAINSMRAGKLPSKWVGDLFARRAQKGRLS